MLKGLLRLFPARNSIVQLPPRRCIPQVYDARSHTSTLVKRNEGYCDFNRYEDRDVVWISTRPVLHFLETIFESITSTVEIDVWNMKHLPTRHIP